MLLNTMRRMHESVPGFAVWNLVVFGIITVPVFADGQQAPRLNIVVKAGGGATNNVKQRLARELIVEVKGENDKPLAGAAVLFKLPDSGPGGAFANDAKTSTVLTNEKGLAVARGFVPNTVVGNFAIEVSAAYQGQVATTSIMQTNITVGAAGAAASTGVSGKVIAIIAIAGAAAAGAGIAASKGGGGSGTTPKTTTTITPGTPSITP